MRIQLSKDLTRLTAGVDPWFFPNPPFDPVDLAENMIKFVAQNNAYGVAYPQLDLPGNFSVFAMQGMKINYVVFNPRIVDVSQELVTLDEACLSFSGLIVPIERPRRIKARFQGPDGDTYTQVFEDLDARVFQHELEHLTGKLFWSSISKLKFDMAVRKAKKSGFDFSKLSYKGNF